MDNRRRKIDQDFHFIHDDVKFSEWIDKTEDVTLRLKKERINKIFLLIFLGIVLVTIVMRIMIGISKDLGMVFGKITLDWVKKEIIDNDPLELLRNDWALRHPNFLWMFTQFTWLTTTLLSFYLFMRLYRYKKDIPIWLKWITTQRILSLITVYESLVCLLFWPTVFLSVDKINWSEPFAKLDFINTFLVHAFIPVILIIYSAIYTIYDRDASLLRKSFVAKGMLYPLLYSLYYITVAFSWNDAYSLTNFKKDPLGSLSKIPLALVVIYFLIGIFMVIHNLLLLKYNKKYNPLKDYDVAYSQQKLIEKVKNRAISKANRDRTINEKTTYLTSIITTLKEEIEELNNENELTQISRTSEITVPEQTDISEDED